MRRTTQVLLCFVAGLACFVLLLRAGVLQLASGTWVPFGGMGLARAGASAALLRDGRILLTGGEGGSGATNSTEFLGTDGTFSPAVPMNAARSKHIAVVLKDGRVLVSGGVTSGGGETNAAEIYDPIGGSWAPVATGMNEARAAATTPRFSSMGVCSSPAVRILAAQARQPRFLIRSQMHSRLRVRSPRRGSGTQQHYFKWKGVDRRRI